MPFCLSTAIANDRIDRNMNTSNDSTAGSRRIEPSIKSRPVYGTLELADTARHLFVADGDGGSALMRLLSGASSELLGNTEIIYVTGSLGHDHSDDLQALGCPRLYVGPTLTAALPRLKRSLENVRMGTQIYLAGSEGGMGQAMQACMNAGIDFQFLQTEHCGSLARRVQCVHCKGITEDVTTQPATCSHCGLLLLVRDHYSRRIAAFQGVNINAEDPSNIPEKVELFS